MNNYNLYKSQDKESEMETYVNTTRACTSQEIPTPSWHDFPPQYNKPNSISAKDHCSNVQVACMDGLACTQSITTAIFSLAAPTKRAHKGIVL